MPLIISKDAGRIQLSHKTWLYPDGTPGVRLDASNYRFLDRAAGQWSTISARLGNMNDVMELFLVTDALRRLDPSTPIRLYLPFFNFAQQDRVCCPGEALSVKVFADLINAQNYDRVTVVDLHSEVSAALINRINHITQAQVIGQYRWLSNFVVTKNVVLVSPDAGANKKTAEVAKYYGHGTYVRCDKKRNLSTGEIIETLVYGDDDLITQRNLLIIDDICVGGATFTSIAKSLLARGAASVSLYTTHGVYSKGTDALRAGGLDKLFTTDSTFLVQPAGIEAAVLKIEEMFPIL